MHIRGSICQTETGDWKFSRKKDLTNVGSFTNVSHPHTGVSLALFLLIVFPDTQGDFSRLLCVYVYVWVSLMGFLMYLLIEIRDEMTNSGVGVRRFSLP